MCSLRDVVVFLAGAFFLHTLSHFLLPYFFSFPIHMKAMELTTGMNLWMIVINAIITIALIWLAAKMKCKKSKD